MTNMTLNFEGDYRPISSNELVDLRGTLKKRLHLSNEVAYHPDCRHYYLVKEGSKKQAQITSGDRFIGNCSVCWKISKSENKKEARNIVTYYCDVVDEGECGFETGTPPPRVVDVEASYYEWLYL